MIKIIFFLTLLFSSPFTMAWVTKNELRAPEGYFWKETISQDESSAKLTLWSEQNLPTPIYYQFDLRYGGLLDYEAVDTEKHLLVARPPHHLWEPHPTSHKTLEKQYFKILEEEGYKLRFPPLVLFKDNQAFYSEMTDFFEIWVPPEEKPPLTALIQKVKNEIEKLEVGLLPSFLKQFNFLEFIVTKTSKSEIGIDVFNLFPLLTLSQEKEVLLEALNHFSSHSQFPLDWFVEMTPKFSLTIRLTTLMLLTHNHLAEDYFIKGVVTLYGVERGWEVALTLNKMYRQERNYWVDQYQVNEKLEGLYEKTGFDDSHLREVPIHLNVNETVWLPQKALYHFYGAFLAAFLMKEKWNVPYLFLPSITAALGLTYKQLTGNPSSKELELIQKIYETGARKTILLYPTLMQN